MADNSFENKDFWTKIAKLDEFTKNSGKNTNTPPKLAPFTDQMVQYEKCGSIRELLTIYLDFGIPVSYYRRNDINTTFFPLGFEGRSKNEFAVDSSTFSNLIAGFVPPYYCHKNMSKCDNKCPTMPSHALHTLVNIRDSLKACRGMVSKVCPSITVPINADHNDLITILFSQIGGNNDSKLMKLIKLMQIEREYVVSILNSK